MTDFPMTDPRPTDLSLMLQKHVKAPPAQVYNAWLNPETLHRFMANGTGFALTKAETDPRVGGRFRLDMHIGGKDYPHSGTYLDLTAHSRIAFTWESASSIVEGSTVTLELVPDAGGTLLTLTHVRFANEGVRDGHAGAWETILGGLAATRL
jgi:uncharacterized protein YndB with AHSA1/START domain